MMVRRLTDHIKQLERIYSIEDGRLQGDGVWAKFPFFWFLLTMSYRCTRKCTYCYAFHEVGYDNKMEMDDSTFSKLLEWIPEIWKANNIKVNVIVFLGGEPLLRTDRIKKVMDSVYNNTCGMQGNVTTNADLVDSVNWDDLEDIQWITTNITDISIPELSRRMQIIGERSNVKGQSIAAVLDDDNLDRILKITRFGVENGYRLRYSRNLFRGLDAEYRRRLLKKYHEVCDLLEHYVTRGFNVYTTFLFDDLIPSWNLGSSPHLCGKRIAAVYPDGSIGPCNRNQPYKTGTIFDTNPLDLLQCKAFHFNFERPDISKECRDCTSRTTCQGGCPNDKLLLTGTSSGKSVMCDIHKEIIPRLYYLDKLVKDRHIVK
jgi:radical SAM protein with 4Fe4S-binding SPASM domain